MNRYFGLMALTTGMMLSVAMPAYALDGNDFAAKLKATMGTGFTVEFGEVTANGDTVTISGFTANPPGEDPKDFDTAITFSGVAEDGKGGYTAKTASIPDVDYTDEEEGVNIKIQNILVTDIAIPADPEADILSQLTIYKTFSMGPVSVSEESKADLVTIQSVKIDNQPNGDLSEFKGHYEVSGIHAEPGVMEDVDAEAAAMMELFDLKVIDGSMNGDMVWNLNSGNLKLTESSITIANVGKLDITGEINGYDLEFIKQLQADQKAMLAKVEEGSDPAEMEAQSQEMMMALLAKLSLVGAKIRFDDDGITSKILDFIAEQNGAPREVMATGFAAAAPAMLAQFGAPQELQNQVLTALTAYFGEPKSLEISLSPAQPVPFMGIAAAAESPDAAIELLQPSIAANN